MMLTIEQITKADDLPLKTVTVPEWGGDVCLRTLTAAERDDWEAAMMKRRGTDGDMNYHNLKAELVAWCLCDEKGGPFFDRPADGTATLAGKSGSVISRLFEVAQELNGLTQRDVEELEKNSVADPAGYSSLTLPGASVAPSGS